MAIFRKTGTMPKVYILLVSMTSLILFDLPTTTALITCYRCQGTSGLLINGTSPFTNCGLPFRDNITFPLPTVQCAGFCVVQAVFSGNATTTIFRTCSDALISDGCEYSVDGDGKQRWSCISTCSRDRCNTGSDGPRTAHSPPTVFFLLATITTTTSAALLRSFYH